MDLHWKRCEFIRFADAEDERNVTVGVVDSVYDPGQFKDYNEFGRSFDVIDANVGATGDHGYKILQLLTTLSHNPEYHLFQAIFQNGRTRDSYLMKAIGKAIEFGEVDVLNVSAGCDHVSDEHRACTLSGARCALSEVAERAVDEGITIVASSGNTPHANSVCCPALSSHTIGVGGVVTRCTATLHTVSGQDGANLPPNAYWVRRSDGTGATGAYCSDRGCMPGQTCASNRKTEPWDKNVEFSARKPDTLAPVHLLARDQRGPILDEGTSFSAPIVTAGIVSTLEWVRADGSNLSPAEIRRAVRNSGLEFDTTDKRHFSMQSFANTLRREQGLGPIEFDRTGPIDLFD